MNGGVGPKQPTAATTSANARLVQEMRDRDRQASALAAAGMVAESVGVAGKGQQQKSAQGLQPPPLLAAGGAPLTAPSTELDSINWNLMDIGAMHLDDMDLDFAQLFDPASELANMQTEGSGWPTTASAPEPGSMPLGPSKPPPTTG